MVTLRRFSEDDAPVLRIFRYPEVSTEALCADIRAWNTLVYKGRYYEMLAVTVGELVVGSVSLYAKDGGSPAETVGAGPDIFPPFRRRGYGREAVHQALALAGSRGFRIASAQIRLDNAASLALHEALGFRRSHAFINAKGNRVAFYLKAL